VKKNIAIVVPHKGIGDIIFHNSLIKSISKIYKTKILLFANKSTKAALIYNNNKYVKQVVYIDLKRPSKIFYLFKIMSISLNLYQYQISKLYYTGNSKWHKMSLILLSIFKKINLKYINRKKKFIIPHLNDLMIKCSVKNLNSYDPNISVNLSKKFYSKSKKLKKPWVFLSIDTSEDQIKIPTNTLIKIINKLKKKYNTIFVNTSKKNFHKTEILRDSKLIKTSNFNILEINFLIKNSRLFIGNESGPAVIASISCKKSIIFLGKNVIPESKKIPNKFKREYIRIDNSHFNNAKILNII
tara:strand:+ start:504 stop:1400 length:897 start_codon:yes stop_codon:yes gene_type:complete